MQLPIVAAGGRNQAEEQQTPGDTGQIRRE
jgi:hypothetical protein